MSNQKSTFQSFSYSSSSSTINGETKSRSETTYSDPSGTRVHRTNQEPGQYVQEERYRTDSSGRRVEDSSSGQAKIEDVTDKEQDAKDREYEERMEDEYAKKEGGA